MNNGLINSGLAKIIPRLLHELSYENFRLIRNVLTSEHIAHECNEWDCVMFLIIMVENCYAQFRAWKTAIQERLLHRNII
ncbi:hypothetical protein KPTHUN262_43050 [Klebsiella pneumoniae]|nr:hypothetical protein KPTHUN262_43050 [Klebsiella pneumoniae]